MLSSAESWHDMIYFFVSTWSWDKGCTTCILKGNTCCVSLSSLIHKSCPIPRELSSSVVCWHMRRPLRCNHSLDWLVGQQSHRNWITRNRKHLFLALWLKTTTGGLSLDSIKRTYWCYYGLSYLPAGMSESCTSTQTIKVNKKSRWVRAFHHKWAPVARCEPLAVLVWETMRVM